tara:strand:- start:180 stop:488 length:309 start_codon:yes stop_codon:yes gene_type:complete
MFDLPPLLSVLINIGYLYLMVRFSFFIFVVLDGGGSISVLQALRNSWKITHDKVLKLSFIYFLLFIFWFIGIWLFLIGFFVALVVSALCLACVYHALKQSSN